MSSPLADTFTSAEREAVNKFKEDYLERALSEAGGDESTTVKIWNVPMTVTEEDSRVVRQPMGPGGRSRRAAVEGVVPGRKLAPQIACRLARPAGTRRR